MSQCHSPCEVGLKTHGFYSLRRVKAPAGVSRTCDCRSGAPQRNHVERKHGLANGICYNSRQHVRTHRSSAKCRGMRGLFGLRQRERSHLVLCCCMGAADVSLSPRCITLLSIATIKRHDQEKVGEERVYFIL